LERVFAPKVDGATHLSELTRELELTHFVCFSSIAGLFGAPGQGAYAAANRYLDALAQARKTEGLPATSIAWGLWRREGMTSGLGSKDVARINRGGIAPLSDAQGLALFDRALASPEPLCAALALERGALRARAKTGALPPMLVGIVPRGTVHGGGQGVLARRLREAPQDARTRIAEDFVRSEVAALLGHSSPARIGPTDAFKDLGFDSLAAVELRNRLSESIEARLGSSVVFDYPTAKALAAHLLEQIGDGGPAPAIELSQLERAVADIAEDDPRRSSLAGRLRALAGELEGRRAPTGESAATQLEQASDEELLDFIDTQVGGQNGG
jgi:acyl carrier protein